MNNGNQLAIVILAAGKGTRMKNPEMAKVMYEICGKPMLAQVIEISRKLNPERILVVVGWKRESIINYFEDQPDLEFVDQQEQLGTGHAIMQTVDKLSNFIGDILVLSGDVPLLKVQTLKDLLTIHKNNNSSATILTAFFDNPTGYGRIIRNEKGNVKKIVEQRDANDDELKVNEINSGIYVFNKAILFEAIKLLKPNNLQGEYYLTDVFEYFMKNNFHISAITAKNHFEVMGINDLTQLEKARVIFQNG